MTFLRRELMGWKKAEIIWLLAATIVIIGLSVYWRESPMWIIIDVLTVYMWFHAFVNNQESIATLLMWSIYLANAFIMFWKWYKSSSKANVQMGGAANEV